MSRPKSFDHQKKTARLLDRKDGTIFDMSDAGTAKTRPALEFTAKRRKQGGGKTLVLCVKTNMAPVWAYENALWTPEMKMSIAYAENRREAMTRDADIYVVNHDGVKWLAERNNAFFKDFDRLIIDESTAFKHRTSARSRAVAKIRKHFTSVELMSGTPCPNGVLDIWHQALLLDRGKRLGASFEAFRKATHEPQEVVINASGKKVIDWVEREFAMEGVYHLLQDVSIRHMMDECTDIPPNHIQFLDIRMPPKLRAEYEVLAREAVLEHKKGTVRGVNAATLRQKLLQLCSGAVYHSEGKYIVLDHERYELVADLALEDPHSIIFFNWQHQKDLLAETLRKKKVDFAVLDGKVRSSVKRTNIINRFQGGELRTLLIHPKTGAHGLTLTRGTSCIWASPVYEPDLFKQGIHRIRRAGQRLKTRTVCVRAVRSAEEIVYTMQQGKAFRMNKLLDMIAEAS